MVDGHTRNVILPTQHNFSLGLPGCRVALFTNEGKPRGEDKLCPRKQLSFASRDNILDLRTRTIFLHFIIKMCNKVVLVMCNKVSLVPETI